MVDVYGKMYLPVPAIPVYLPLHLSVEVNLHVSPTDETTCCVFCVLLTQVLAGIWLGMGNAVGLVGCKMAQGSQDVP